MNWFDMPPLAALRAFSAFAESGNVVQAGAALNVSHAAISQQLRALEKYFDTALLDRSGRTMVLTEEGAHLARALSLGFGAIGSAVDDLLRQKRARPLHISTTAAFAAGWLMPRLSAFRASNPDIDLMIDASPTFADLTPGGVDLAIRYGHGARIQSVVEEASTFASHRSRLEFTISTTETMSPSRRKNLLLDIPRQQGIRGAVDLLQRQRLTK